MIRRRRDPTAKLNRINYYAGSLVVVVVVVVAVVVVTAATGVLAPRPVPTHRPPGCPPGCPPAVKRGARATLQARRFISDWKAWFVVVPSAVAAAAASNGTPEPGAGRDSDNTWPVREGQNFGIL